MNYNSVTKQFCISIYAIFLGSQITESFLLVPYWQSLRSEEFYSYYAEFGPSIGRFYTVLTILASLIPISVAVKYFTAKSKGATPAILSAIFSILVILSFYVYFKTVNGYFYQSAFNELDLHKELVTWNYWHWSRIILETTSLIFLIVAFAKSEIKGSASD